MRSVFMLFETRHRDAVVEFLDQYCDEKFKKRETTQWNVLKNGDGMFYIDEISMDQLLMEIGDDSPYLYILETLQKPLCCWQIDISGRHDGTVEIKQLLHELLSQINGFAMDDFTEYFWTLEEIENGTLVEGRAFFDYTRLADSKNNPGFPG